MKNLVDMSGSKSMHWLLMFVVSPIWSLRLGALSNKHLRVAASPWRPFLMWKCPNQTKWSGWSGEWEKECPNDEEKKFRYFQNGGP